MHRERPILFSVKQGEAIECGDALHIYVSSSGTLTAMEADRDHPFNATAAEALRLSNAIWIPKAGKVINGT